MLSLRARQCLREYVCGLFSSGAVDQLDCLSFDNVPDIVVSDIDMLRPRMVLTAMSKRDRRLVVAMESGGLLGW